MDGSNDCDLLPNMTSSTSYIENNWTEFEGYLSLGVATPNIGWGPLEMHGTGECYCDTILVNCSTQCPDGSYPKENVVQTVYHKSGGVMTTYELSAGTMTYHPQHQHIHVDNWTFNTLRIRGNDPNPTTWPIIGQGSKISFCLINLGTCTALNGYCQDELGVVYDEETMPNGGLGIVSGCEYDQGIFVGKFDAYDEYLDGQTIEFGDVCNGDYYIVSQTDPLTHVLETNDSDNWSSVLINLNDQQQGICCDAHFKADTTNGLSPFQVQFVDSTVPIASSWLWDFGDGNTSTDQFPKHVYTTPGQFTVKLIVNTTSGCIDTFEREQYITVNIGTGITSLFDIKKIELTAFPNPTFTSSTIELNLNEASYLNLAITDLAGNVVKTLFEGVHPFGKHVLFLDLINQGWPAGMYIVHAKAGSSESFLKLIML
jgi:hypothetical protein